MLWAPCPGAPRALDHGTGASKNLLPLRGGKDTEHLAVLCHRPTRDLYPFPLFQQLDDGLIAEGVLLVFFVDELLDRLLDALAGDVLVRDAADAGVEEVLQLEEPLWRMNVFVRGDARYCRLVHADGLGDVAQDHRLQVGDALLEEVTLLLDDALGHTDDRLAPLLDGPDEPLRVAELLAHELLRRGVAEQPLGEVLVDVQPLDAPVVVEDHELVGVLD